MNYQIRELKSCEIPLLNEFLYEAIFIPEGAQAPPKDIVKHPDLQKYIADFGGKDDVCYVAEVEGKVIGAVWTRIIHDFGHVDDETPSFSISLFKEYRNLGIGTALMKQILLTLKGRGYRQVSLSVQKANSALRMYEKLGFEVARENEQDCIMIRRLLFVKPPEYDRTKPDFCARAQSVTSAAPRFAAGWPLLHRRRIHLGDTP